jgi:hypothetical protein
MKRMFYLVLRYTAAINVAFITSTLLLWALASVTRMAKHLTGVSEFAFLLVSMSIVFAITGFAGVYAGARCLPCVSRRFGSVFLSCLGLVFAGGVAAVLLVLLQPNTYWDLLTLPPVILGMSMLTIGATGAILLIWKLWPGEAGSRTAGPPQGGETDEAKKLSQT